MNCIGGVLKQRWKTLKFCQQNLHNNNQMNKPYGNAKQPRNLQIQKNVINVNFSGAVIPLIIHLN